MERVAREIFAGSLAASSTAALFSPLECVKTRLQVQADPGSGLAKPLYRQGFVAALRTILKEDGARLLWTHGFAGFVGRDFFYSGIRIGLYPTFRSFYSNGKDREDVMLLEKIAAGATTGAVGSGLANPFDVVRVRMTVEGGCIDSMTGKLSTGMRTGMIPRWHSSMHCLRETARQEGVFRGLWRGFIATMSRAALLSAGQLSSYDHSKVFIVKQGWMEEGKPLHLMSAVISGLVATTVCNPADVFKSRLMMLRGGGQHVTAWEVARLIWTTEGAMGFMRGWGPAYARAGPTFFIQMPIVEGLRNAFGVGHL